MQKFVRRFALLLFLSGLPSLDRAQPPSSPSEASPLLPAPPTAEELRRALTTAEIDKKQLSAELAAAWKETEQAKAEAMATQKRADAAIKKNLADQGGKSSELLQQVQSLQADRAQLQQQVAEFKSRPVPTPLLMKPATDELQVKLSSALRSYSVVEAENSRLKTQLAEKTQEASQLTAQYNAMHTAVLSIPTPTPVAVVPTPTPTPVDDRLATVLHSFALLQNENDKLRSENSRLQNDDASLSARLAEAQANLQAAGSIAAQAPGLRDQLRQTQDQSAAFAEENLRLRTQLSLSASGRSNGPLVPQAVPVSPDATAPPAPTPSPASLVSVSPNPSRGTSAPTSATATTATATAPNEPAPRTHVIATGDTLSKISMTYYGTANRWASIMAANRDVLRDEKSLVIGRTLRIP